ncbi:hypothetical protein NL676_029752 [Syzygium grande]|nr:hypothetical protein NL676_029752 [Syzygium grande]
MSPPRKIKLGDAFWVTWLTRVLGPTKTIHPSPAGVKVPIAVLGAEIDHMSPPALIKQFEEVLAAKSEVDEFVKIFPKVSHGWTVRYKVEDKAAVKSAEEAHLDMIQWFVKFVKLRRPTVTVVCLRAPEVPSILLDRRMATVEA